MHRIALALLIVLSVFATSLMAQPSQGNVRVLVPAYGNPASNPTMWTTLTQLGTNYPASISVIFNPASGPGSVVDPNYVNAAGQGPLVNLLNTNAQVLGYVTIRKEVNGVRVVRTLAEIQADVLKYYQNAYWRGFSYRLDGIFFDEFDPDLQRVPLYRSLRDYVRGLAANAVIIGNPGIPFIHNVTNQTTYTVDDLVNVFDALVIFENYQSSFDAGFAPPNWVNSSNRARVGMIAHTGPASTLQATFALMMQRGAGWVYLTDDAFIPNPYDALSSYLAAQVDLVRLPRTVGGTLSGLSAGASLTLRNVITGQTLTRNANGAFTFATTQTAGGSYSVQVMNQPMGQLCSVAGGSGVVTTGNISSISVHCAANAFVIGGALSGLLPSRTLTLKNLINDEIAVLTTNGNFNFSTAASTNSTYNVVIQAQPLGQNCSILNGNGTVGNSNVNDIQIACSINNYPIGGSVSGLFVGRNLTLRNTVNGAERLVDANGPFSFNAPIPSGSSYNIVVQNQPPGQSCAVNNSSGSVGGQPVSNITVSCSLNSYRIRGVLSGLAVGQNVTLRNSQDAGELVLSTNAPFAFPNEVASGSSYDVSVLAQPSSQSCTVSNGSGTVLAGDVTTIAVTCSAHTVLTQTSVVVPSNGVLRSNVRAEFHVALANGTAVSVGTVTVSDGQGTSCTASVAAASCELKFYSTGNRVVTASYSGNGTFMPSLSLGQNHSVLPYNLLSLSVSASPATVTMGSSVTLSGQLGTTPASLPGEPPWPVPTGTIQFSAGNVPLCQAIVGSSCDAQLNQSGSVTVLAQYAGDANYLPIVGLGGVTVSPPALRANDCFYGSNLGSCWGHSGVVLDGLSFGYPNNSQLGFWSFNPALQTQLRLDQQGQFGENSPVPLISVSSSNAGSLGCIWQFGNDASVSLQPLPAATAPPSLCAFELRGQRYLHTLFLVDANRLVTTSLPITTNDSCARSTPAPAPWLNLVVNHEKYLEGTLVDEITEVRTARFIAECQHRSGFE